VQEIEHKTGPHATYSPKFASEITIDALFLRVAVVATAVDLSRLKTWTWLIVQLLRSVSQFSSVIVSLLSVILVGQIEQ